MREGSSFNTNDIETSRQEMWERDSVHRVVENPDQEKYFIVDMFPYPSGSGIHVGHVKNYVATDVQARMLTRQGLNVLHPMGFDSFGLPAENYAISMGIHPRIAVNQNIERFSKQLRRLGLGYDWERQISTADDDFVRWTQDGFLTLYEMGLVTEEEQPINWCDSCKTGLSNEDLDEESHCERCGSEVERKLVRQWSVHITDYADELLDGMEELSGWEPFLLDIQRNWIGRQEGWEVATAIQSSKDEVLSKIFIKNPSELTSAQYLAISPETADKLKLADLIEDSVRRVDAESYIKDNLYKRDKDRKGATGVCLPGLYTTNPYNGEQLPVFIAESVLPTTDNGAMFGSPSLRERDMRFALNMGLNPDSDTASSELSKDDIDYFVGLGVLSPKKIYRLEDWVFSRQRFWGEPIPIVHCGDCGVVPVPRDQLPVLLPDVESYQLTDTGESPLASIDSWVNTTCPKCGGDAKRETNTMPQWAGSSWYWHRYKDPHDSKYLVSPEADKYWGQVDMYVGGAEHAARHLIYGRFWNFALQKAGVVLDKEPFKKVQHVGLVMDENGVKISKRLGNGVDLDAVVEEYGADSLRLGVMQMGEFSQQTNWNNNEIKSARRFLVKIWGMQERVDWSNTKQPSEMDLQKINEVVEKVTKDISNFKFNTAIAAIRMYVTSLEHKKAEITSTEFTSLLSLLQPFAPHLTEQILVNKSGNEYMMKMAWPTRFNIESELPVNREIVVMCDGKKMGVFNVSNELQNEEEILESIRGDSEPINHLFENQQVKVIISPPGRNLINLVTKK